MDDTYDYRRLLGYQIITAEVLVKRALLSLLTGLGLHLTFEQWMVLNALYVEPGLIQSEVAARTRKDKANITHILRLLERDGLVRRRPHPNDRRRCQIYLTDGGEDMLDHAVPSIKALNAHIRRGIDDAGLAVFEEVLARMNDNLRTLSEGSGRNATSPLISAAGEDA